MKAYLTLLFFIILSISLVIYIYLKLEQDSYINLNNILISTSEENELKSLMFDIQKLFENLNIPFIAHCGTLLGLKRHKAIIPWDDDCDILINKKDLIKLFDYKENLNLQGYNFAKNDYFAKYGTFYKISYQKNKSLSHYPKNDPVSWPFVDIFTYEEDDKYIYNFHAAWEFHVLPKDHFYPFKKYPFYDSYLWGPNKIDECLSKYFGPKFMDECMISSNYYNHRLGQTFKYKGTNKFFCKDLVEIITNLKQNDLL